MSFDAAVHAKAVRLDRLALEMCAAAGSGHPTTAMSLGHIVTVLMYHGMRWSPEAPEYPTSDRLVLSAGHGVPIVYAALADLGAIVNIDGEKKPLTIEYLSTLRESNSCLDGHPNPRVGVSFFDAATGSLGQGLSIAAGLGLVANREKSDRRHYCIIGDGEFREGQIAEALDFIVDHGLTNVLPIINCNGYGQADRVSEQQSAEKICSKLEAYGFKVAEIDGHNPTEVKNAISLIEEDQLCAVVARTIKGWGVRSLQGSGWHGKVIDGDRLEGALNELAEFSVELTTNMDGEELLIYPPKEPAAVKKGIDDFPTFTRAMQNADMTSTLQTGSFATRQAYGIALRELGKNYDDVWVFDADVSNSTFAQTFSQEPEQADRFVECKIAEQNMISAAVGASCDGKVPFCSSFSKFLTRAYDQIEMGLYSGANLKIVGSHSGISLAADGPSQMSLPDVAWFRSLGSVKDHNGFPGCYVLQPADAFASYRLTKQMYDHNGLCYMRTHRPSVEFLYDDTVEFKLGGFEILNQGRDLLIASAGYMIHECNKALDDIDKMGIDATLVDLYSLPFDQESFLDLANENGGQILVVEDNFKGGLSSAISEACTEAGDAFTVKSLCVNRIPKSARTTESILVQCGVDYKSISKSVATLLGVAAV